MKFGLGEKWAVIAKDIILLVLALVAILAFMTAVSSMFNLAEEQVHWFDAALGCAIALAVLLRSGGRIAGEPMTTKESCEFWLSFSDPDAPRGKRIPGVAIVDMDTDASAVEIVRHTWKPGINPMGLP